MFITRITTTFCAGDGIKNQVMRYFFLLICLGFAGTVCAQHELHGNSRPWEVFVGGQLPIGKWAKEVDFYVPGKPVYHASFSGRTGQHARVGFHAGICYTRTSVGRSGFAKNFQLIFYPGIFSAVLYDLESNGPAIASSKMKPWLQFEAAVAPCYSLNTGGNTVKFYGRFGVALKHTGGEIHYEPSTLDWMKYSYSGVGVTLGPGVKLVAGRIGIGAELQLAYTTGKYKGEGYYSNSTNHWTNTIPNCIFRSPAVSVSIGYAFGG